MLGFLDWRISDLKFNFHLLTNPAFGASGDAGDNRGLYLCSLFRVVYNGLCFGKRFCVSLRRIRPHCAMQAVFASVLVCLFVCLYVGLVVCLRPCLCHCRCLCHCLALCLCLPVSLLVSCLC